MTLVVTLLVGGSALALFHKPAASLLFRNLANISLNKELWLEDRSTSERQRALAQIANLLDSSLTNDHAPYSPRVTGTPCAMMSATAIALSYRWQRDWANAAIWFRRAAEARPTPPLQNSVLLPAFLRVNAQGNLVIDWEDTYWRFAGGSLAYRGNNATVTSLSNDGEIRISYQNDLGTTDHFEYSWFGEFHFSSWRLIEVNVRIHPGTFLTIETLSDRGRVRHINYYEGTGNWERIKFPIEGTLLQQFLISLSEPPALGLATPTYAIDIKPITFILDEAAATCAL